MPPLRASGLDEADGRRRARARLAPVPGAGGDQLRAVQRQSRVHVLRLLLVQRLLPRRQGLDRRHRHPAGRGDGPAAGRDRGARDAHRRRPRRPRHGRRPIVQDGRERFQPAARRPPRHLRLREHAPPAPVHVDRLSRAASRTTTARSASTTWRTSTPVRLRPLPRPPAQPLQRPLGAVDLRRRLERRQLRPRRDSASSAAAC